MSEAGPILAAMPLDEALWEVWKNGGSAVVAAVLTAALLKAQGVRGEVATHDRLATYVGEDLARWVRDRERAAGVRLDEIRQDAASKGVTSGGLLAKSRGKVYTHVAHEYRDEALRKLRMVDELGDQEGRLHARVRRRTGELPQPRLPEDCRVITAKWHAEAEIDVARPELEPRLVELKGGDE